MSATDLDFDRRVRFSNLPHSLSHSLSLTRFRIRCRHLLNLDSGSGKNETLRSLFPRNFTPPFRFLTCISPFFYGSDLASSSSSCREYAFAEVENLDHCTKYLNQTLVTFGFPASLDLFANDPVRGQSP